MIDYPNAFYHMMVKIFKINTLKPHLIEFHYPNETLVVIYTVTVFTSP